MLNLCVSLCADIEEKGVTMKLTVIDTPGFGDQINNENWSVLRWDPLCLRPLHSFLRSYISSSCSVTLSLLLCHFLLSFPTGTPLPFAAHHRHLLPAPSSSWQPIMKFINDQYEAYLQEEININRKKRIPDTRVHCCIYFIPPTGHW